MGKLSYLTSCGMTFVIGPLFIIILLSTGALLSNFSSLFFLYYIASPSIVFGFVILILGFVTMSIEKRKKVKEKNRPSFGCPNCVSAYRLGLKKCPGCNTKLRDI